MSTELAARTQSFKKYPLKWAISEWNGYAAHETFSGVLHASVRMSLYHAEYMVTVQVRIPGGMWGIPHPVRKCFTRNAAMSYVEENLLAADTALRLLSCTQPLFELDNCYLMSLLGFPHDPKLTCKDCPGF